MDCGGNSGYTAAPSAKFRISSTIGSMADCFCALADMAVVDKAIDNLSHFRPVEYSCNIIERCGHALSTLAEGPDISTFHGRGPGFGRVAGNQSK
jgi:hypothetical protein